MGKLDFFVPVDMQRGNGFDGDLVSATAGVVTYRDGDVVVEYEGDFEISGGNPVDGTIEEYRVSEDDEVLYRGREFNADFQEHIEVWEAEGYISAASVLLADSDRLWGTEGDDVLVGYGGDDRMKGFEGDDELFGGAGDERLRGNQGDDTLFGQGGDDFMKGHSGSDFLYGGAGDDIVKGGSGNDTLVGQDGKDRMLGGNGVDTFVFDDDDGSSATSSRDLVRDFEVGTDILRFTSGGAAEDVDTREISKGTVLTYGDSEIVLVGVDEFDTSTIDFL